MLFIMRLSQFCKNELQAQYTFTYQNQYMTINYQLQNNTVSFHVGVWHWGNNKCSKT